MSQAIPKFFVYGEPVRPLDIEFMHCETVMARYSVHAGHVAPHMHPHMAQITFWTSGHGAYSIEDRTWEFSAPAVSLVPSHIVHGFDIQPGADAIVVSIANEALHMIGHRVSATFDKPLFVAGKGNEIVWRRLATTMRHISAEFADRLEASNMALHALVALALINIGRLHIEAVQSAIPTNFDLANKLQRLVEQRYREELQVGDYVNLLGTTPHLLTKASQEVLAGSVKEIVSRRRFLEAKRLLQFTVRSVEDIGYELGFKDPAYFSRFFRRWAGQSPANWRVTQTMLVRQPAKRTNRS